MITLTANTVETILSVLYTRCQTVYSQAKVHRRFYSTNLRKYESSNWWDNCSCCTFLHSHTSLSTNMSYVWIITDLLFSLTRDVLPSWHSPTKDQISSAWLFLHSFIRHLKEEQEAWPQDGESSLLREINFSYLTDHTILSLSKKNNDKTNN